MVRSPERRQGNWLAKSTAIGVVALGTVVGLWKGQQAADKDPGHLADLRAQVPAVAAGHQQAQVRFDKLLGGLSQDCKDILKPYRVGGDHAGDWQSLQKNLSFAGPCPRNPNLVQTVHDEESATLNTVYDINDLNTQISAAEVDASSDTEELAIGGGVGGVAGLIVGGIAYRVLRRTNT